MNFSARPKYFELKEILGDPNNFFSLPKENQTELKNKFNNTLNLWKNSDFILLELNFRMINNENFDNLEFAFGNTLLNEFIYYDYNYKANNLMLYEIFGIAFGAYSKIKRFSDIVPEINTNYLCQSEDFCKLSTIHAKRIIIKIPSNQKPEEFQKEIVFRITKPERYNIYDFYLNYNE